MIEEVRPSLLIIPCLIANSQNILNFFARVFDHDKQVYLKDFRSLTLGWSDGNTFLPIDFSLISSSKHQNVLGPEKHFDARSLAVKRRRQAQRKLNDVVLELIDAAQKNEFTSKYVLFDSWFTSPHTCLPNF